MKICIFSIAFLLFAPGKIPVQQYATSAALVKFRSDAPLMTLESNNYFAVFRIDSDTGMFICEVPVELFEFDMPGMKHNFNKYFMDSERFPKATLVGLVSEIQSVDFEKDGNYPIRITGNLTIRGVVRQVQTSGRIEVRKRLPTIYGTLSIALSDYGIPYPEYVRKKVSDNLTLTLVARCGQNFR